VNHTNSVPTILIINDPINKNTTKTKKINDTNNIFDSSRRLLKNRTDAHGRAHDAKMDFFFFHLEPK